MAVRKLNQQQNLADILLRVSTQTQADDDRFSLPTQLAACQTFAAAHGWQVYSVQQDSITGETVNRPGFQTVLDHLREGHIGRVIVYDVDRAGRDTYVGATLLHECKEAGATLHIQQMPDLELGGTGPSAYMAETMFFWRLTQAAQELAGIRERTQRGRRGRVAADKPIVGAVPLFGYSFTADAKGRVSGYVLHPVYAPIVRRIFTEVANGIPLSRVCAGLTRDGIPTRSQVAAQQRPHSKRRTIGTRWLRDAVSDIIHHPAYAGSPVANRHVTRRAHGVDSDTGKPVTHYYKAERAASEMTPLSTAVWPAIVSAELAARAQARLAANQEEASRRIAAVDTEATLLRGGYVYCRTCGLPMTTYRQHHDSRRKERGTYAAYICRKGNTVGGRERCGQSIAAATLDAQVWAHVERLAANQSVAERAMARWYTRFDQQRQRQAAALTTAEEVVRNAAQDEAHARRTLTEMEDERYKARLRLQWQEAVDHLEMVEARLVALKEEMGRDTTLQQYANLQAWAAEWRSRVATATYADKRQALHRLGLRVFVSPAREPLKVMRAGRGLPGGEQRRYFVVVGWPAGVRRALPGLPVPLVDAVHPQWYYPAALAAGTDSAEVARVLDTGDFPDIDTWESETTFWLVPTEEYGELLQQGLEEQAAADYASALGDTLGETLGGAQPGASGEAGEPTAGDAPGDDAPGFMSGTACH